MLKPTSSSDSWEFPWNGKMRKNRPLTVPPSQSGRQIGEICFMLCFLAVLMLSSSLSLIGLSIWSLVIKAVNYRYLLDIKVDIPYFSLPAAFLLLPGFWIAASSHNTRKRLISTYLLLIIITLSSILLITGSSIGLNYTVKTENGDNQIYSSLENSDLNKSVSFSFLRYNTSEDDKYAWDRMQQRLECCGISNYHDWETVGLDIPNSCCNEDECTAETSFGRSCLDSMSRDLVWHQNILKSQCYIMAVVQIGTGAVSLLVYFAGRFSN
ncbi:tetraspanin-6-like [Diorhabda sublineata]|uniref:tetraspanin-6-like n=1 Tax=Diorhabda sublineata TaxID=1163346 RepID=UPI0024E0D1A1|nr:tetraspanin-6-like [Diorhabda sublineata]